MSTDILADVRTALRHWRRRPTLPVTVIFTLTAGLGVAVGVFAVSLGRGVASPRCAGAAATGVD